MEDIDNLSSTGMLVNMAEFWASFILERKNNLGCMTSHRLVTVLKRQSTRLTVTAPPIL